MRPSSQKPQSEEAIPVEVLVVTPKRKRYRYLAKHWGVSKDDTILTISLVDGGEVHWPLDSIMYWKVTALPSQNSL